MIAEDARIEVIVSAFVAAWNDGDGNAIASLFAADADFINVLGAHDRGREAIAASHRDILDTVYRGSVNRYTVRAIRWLGDDLAVVFADALLKFSVNDTRRELAARPTMLLRRTGGAWRIEVFQNTAVAPVGARSGADLPRTSAA